MVEDFVFLVECLLSTTVIELLSLSYETFVDCLMLPSDVMLETHIERSSILSPALAVTRAGFNARELARPELSCLRYIRRRK